MTIAAPRPTEGSAGQARPTVAWTTIQAGLWVGNAAGEFAGEFFITDHRARPLGTCTTLDEAKARHQRQFQLSQSAQKRTI